MNQTAEVLIEEKPERLLLEPGWYKDLSNKDYHRSGGTSSSALKVLMEQTGAHLQYKRSHPKEPTPSMGLGTAVHCLTLEPENFDRDIAIMPELNGRTNAGKLEKQNFFAENAGKTIITQEQFDQAEIMVARIHDHPIANILLDDVITESSVYWWYKSMDRDDDTRYREMVKVRPDAISKSHPIVIDLKTVKDGSYSGFIRSIQDYYYHLSAAMYLEGVNQCMPLLEELGFMAYLKFVFVCVESEPPYEVSCYELSEEYMAIGKQIYRMAMRRLAESRAANWPGFPEEVRIIEPPAYATRGYIV